MVFRLFSSTTHASLSQYGTPEILRTPLLALCLQTKLLAPPNTPIADFLARVPDPPPFLITRNAVQALKSLEALDPWEESLDPGVDSRSGGCTSPAIAHHTNQCVLAWGSDASDDIDQKRDWKK